MKRSNLILIICAFILIVTLCAILVPRKFEPETTLNFLGFATESNKPVARFRLASKESAVQTSHFLFIEDLNGSSMGSPVYMKPIRVLEGG